MLRQALRTRLSNFLITLIVINYNNSFYEILINYFDFDECSNA